MSIAFAPEDITAQRDCKHRVVDLDRDIGACFLADALPSRANFARVAPITCKDPVVRSIFAVGWLGGDEREFGMKREYRQTPLKAVGGRDKCI